MVSTQQKLEHRLCLPVLLQMLWVTGWVNHCSGSSRWRSTRTADNIDLIDNWCYTKMAKLK